MSRRKCAICGNEMREQAGYWLEGYKRDVCEECYRDGTKTCQLCGNDDCMPSDISDFMLFKAELSWPAGRVPGIYLALDYPFLHGSILGPESLKTYQVCFVEKLPEADGAYEISGNVCLLCAKPYVEKLRTGYRRSRDWLAHHRFPQWERGKYRRPPRTWMLERHHTRKVILDNPGFLMDLEVSPTDRDWQEFRTKFLLPDLPTYRPWVLLTHKGITIYRVYDGRNSSAWLTVREDPEFRNTYRPETFDATALPTWRRAPWRDRYYADDYDEENREAVITAIDMGVLTQNGVNRTEGMTK